MLIPKGGHDNEGGQHEIFDSLLSFCPILVVSASAIGSMSC